jgi:predicted ATPase
MTPFTLKSIHPVNLLSFGPDTKSIEVRRLNILIGPNGSGKSNFIEVIRLLHFLPDKDPWSVALATGGVGEWIWKGTRGRGSFSSLGAGFLIGDDYQESHGLSSEHLDFEIRLELAGNSFRVKNETLKFSGKSHGRFFYTRTGREGGVGPAAGVFANEPPSTFYLESERSILSQLASPAIQGSEFGIRIPEAYQVAEFLERFDFHQDWEFGVDCPPRDPQPVGQPVDRLAEDGSNLAQMLANYRDYHKPTFEAIEGLVARFYEFAAHVAIRNVGTRLEIAIEEKGGYSTPAARLSDGMLRWLAILCVLLNPNPAPVTCIDEPELGLHPDILPILADLMRDASARTLLIATTHSPTLIDAFSESDDAESVCVTEKIQGSTVIRRLKADELSVWLEGYSLGSLWTSGQIGGNRW